MRLVSRGVLYTLFLLVVSLSAFSRGANKGQDKKDDSIASALNATSVFLHGYIHGYEEGFHNADLDIQMAHGFRDVTSLSAYKKISTCPGAAGEKNRFERGYRQGFRVGYVDGMSGRHFRAAQSLQVAIDGLAQQTWSSQRKESFELGIQTGYFAGQAEGLHDGRVSAAFRAWDPGCTALEQSGPAGKDPAYCDGFRRAYTVGYSDGYTNQQDNPHVAVK